MLWFFKFRSLNKTYFLSLSKAYAEFQDNSNRMLLDLIC